MTVTAFGLARRILFEHRNRTYREIANQDYPQKHPDGTRIIKAGTLNRIAKSKGNWIPKDPQIAKVLGLRVVCRICGRPFRSPSPQARQVHASPAQRWWWSLSPAKRAKLMERNYKERK